MTTDGSVTWHAIQTTVAIAEHDAIKITLDDHDVAIISRIRQSMESYFRFKNTGPLNNDYYLILAMTI
jgi:hypothetical protein